MWTITRLKNLRDVYVERYLFSIFVVVKVPKLPINEYKIINQYRLTYTSLKFFNLVIVHTLDFWYMIKNK